MGRGDSSWQDRKHHIGNSRGGKKPSTGKISPVRKNVESIETTPTVDYSVGEIIMCGGDTGSNETYDSSKGYKGTSAPTATINANLKVNISGAVGTGRNIVQ